MESHARVELPTEGLFHICKNNTPNGKDTLVNHTGNSRDRYTAYMYTQVTHTLYMKAKQ